MARLAASHASRAMTARRAPAPAAPPQWGSEGIISTGGPLVGLSSILLFPMFWSIPVSMIVARLSVAYPDNGGFVIWVERAFVREVARGLPGGR